MPVRGHHIRGKHHGLWVPGEEPPIDYTFGPTLGAQAVRDGTAPHAVTVFPGTPGVNFTQLNPAASQATNQAAINADATRKVWAPKGFYAEATHYIPKPNTEYRFEGKSLVSGWPNSTRSVADSAILDGGNGALNSLFWAPVLNVTVKGGKFQNQGNASSATYARAIFANGGITKGGWLVEDAEICNNYNIGIGFAAPNCIGRRIYAHDNGRYGINAAPNTSGDVSYAGRIYEYCRVSGNNTRHLNVGGDAGGSKFLYTDGLILRYMWVHDNYGFGLWPDFDNLNAVIEENVCENNRSGGIFYEASFGGTVINNNLLLNNGIGAPTDPQNPEPPDWFRAVQLLVSCSDGTLGPGTGIDVHHNIIDGAYRAMGAINHPDHPNDSKDIAFHHNQLWLRNATAISGASGSVGGQDSQTTKTLWTASPAVTFEDNEYHVALLGTSYHKWDSGTGGGSIKTRAQWQAYGHDNTGTWVAI